MTKICKSCNIEKDESQFTRIQQGKYLYGKCRSCKKIYDQNYRKNNKDYFIKYHSNLERKKKNNIRRQERLKTDINYKIKQNLRSRLSNSLRAQNILSKSCHTIDLLGCNVTYLKQHIESKFQPGMSWNNYGFGDDKWHIDHIKPCASFDLTDPEQQKQCFHYTNLQPLWQFQNLSKNKK